MKRIALSDYVGLARSLVMYYANPRRGRRQVQFYAQFIRPGDLGFDIGAHVGSRLRLWSRLGARIVAVEPQPLFVRFLRLAYGRRPHITLLESALGAEPGEQEIYISRRTPTVTSLSREWITTVRRINAFAGYEWEGGQMVRVQTLDELIAAYGEPAFCKIDVEGYELEILKGLSRPLKCLSFEYIPASIVVAQGCLERLEALGRYEYNYTEGENPVLCLERWVTAEWMAGWLAARPVEGPSGDVYARRVEAHSAPGESGRVDEMNDIYTRR
jgi:FkbM family methyltransferase